MSEIYRNSSEFVHLDIYGDVADAPPIATLKVTGVTYDDDHPAPTLSVNGPTTVDGAERWEATVGFTYTQEVGEVAVIWNFTIDGVDAAKTDYFDIVVPLVEVGTIRTELDIPSEVSDDKIILTERRVRMVIEQVTGQGFSPRIATYYGITLPGGNIRLPQRLISLTAVAGIDNTQYYAIAGDNWSLNTLIPNPLKRTGVRAGEIAVIDPWARTSASRAVMITGRWGYERVPTDIQEAALILIEQYLCPESIYAERYLKTMTAADFRFEFDPGAYAGTGNVIADHLLSKYTVRGAAVI